MITSHSNILSLDQNSSRLAAGIEVGLLAIPEAEEEIVHSDISVFIAISCKPDINEAVLH